MSDDAVSSSAPVWKERFEKAPDPKMLDYSSSLDVDRRLWKYDIACSRAHIEAQLASSVIGSEDAAALKSALDAVEAEFESGEFPFSGADEDIHMAIERRLGELCGPVAGRLHAGRSRNDQVVTDFRLWIKDASKEAVAALLGLIEALRKKALEVGDALTHEYTHLQRAQPIPVAHHLLAHAWPLLRDCKRFENSYSSADCSPLGAAAGAGTSLITDTSVAAGALGFGSVFENSIDAVSDRDFAADFVYACASAQVHMSRLAEELVIWTSQEFGFVELSDAWSTGSSIMPQKKNPDVAELARGRAARAIAAVGEILVLLKGLPLAYNRDLQEDKRIAFSAADTVISSAEALAGLVSTASFNTAKMAEDLEGSFALATDVAEELVRRGVPFRDAHNRVARLVRILSSRNRRLDEADSTDLQEAGITELSAEDLASFSAKGSVESRTAPGMASPKAVGDQIESLGHRIEEISRWARN